MLISLQGSGGYLRGFPQTANKLVSSQWEGLDSIQGYIGREGAETGIQGPQLLVADFGGVLQFPSLKENVDLRSKEAVIAINSNFLMLNLTSRSTRQSD